VVLLAFTIYNFTIIPFAVSPFTIYYLPFNILSFFVSCSLQSLESFFPTSDSIFGHYGFADIATCRNPYTKLPNCDMLLLTLKGRKKAGNELTVLLEQLTTLLLERNGLLQRLSNILTCKVKRGHIFMVLVSS